MQFEQKLREVDECMHKRRIENIFRFQIGIAISPTGDRGSANKNNRTFMVMS